MGIGYWAGLYRYLVLLLISLMKKICTLLGPFCPFKKDALTQNQTFTVFCAISLSLISTNNVEKTVINEPTVNYSFIEKT